MKKQTLIVREDNLELSLVKINRDLHELTKNGDMEVSIKPLKVKRLEIMNRLQFHWYRELGEQGDQTADEYRTDCKYYFGLPIMLADNDNETNQMKAALKEMDIEVRKLIVRSMAVTSTFDTSQMRSYLSSIKRTYSQHGFILTDNNDLIYRDMINFIDKP